MIVEKITAELQALNEILALAQNDSSNAPEGSLRITHSRNRTAMYHKKDSHDQFGTYIKKADNALARKLAQKQYANSIEAIAEPRAKLLKKLLADYNKNDLISVYDKYIDDRKALVSPYLLSDEEYVKEWLSQKTTAEDVEERHPEHLLFNTAKGEMVRSKSEVIIADFLKRIGVPYVYEAPIFYGVDSCFHPDFTVLNVKRRKEMYIEHFGRMDGEDYRDSFFWKFKHFSKMGLKQGDNLIMLFEDKDHQFNIGDHEEWLKELLLN